MPIAPLINLPVGHDVGFAWMSVFSCTRKWVFTRGEGMNFIIMFGFFFLVMDWNLTNLLELKKCSFSRACGCYWYCSRGQTYSSDLPPQCTEQARAQITYPSTTKGMNRVALSSKHHVPFYIYIYLQRSFWQLRFRLVTQTTLGRDV